MYVRNVFICVYAYVCTYSFTVTTKIRNTYLCGTYAYGYVRFLYFMVFGFYRMQGGIEAEREEWERWINRVKKMMDSVGDEIIPFLVIFLLHIT